MNQKRSYGAALGTCSAVIGSSANAMKAQKLLERANVQASVGKSTTASGCVYVINFPCIYKEKAEELLRLGGIRIKGFL